jgi:structural maintenance of chromosome 1
VVKRKLDPLIFICLFIYLFHFFLQHYANGTTRSLDMEDSDEPYLDGIKYHAMPPLKRFRDMEHLSGGEKTMAALALLFAIHSYQPSPFFVLDEVDAALDNANVAKIAAYIRRNAGPGMQFIVISLKTGLFQGSEALVGIHRDQSANSSKALTLDVSCLFLFPLLEYALLLTFLSFESIFDSKLENA